MKDLWLIVVFNILITSIKRCPFCFLKFCWISKTTARTQTSESFCYIIKRKKNPYIITQYYLDTINPAAPPNFHTALMSTNGPRRFRCNTTSPYYTEPDPIKPSGIPIIRGWPSPGTAETRSAIAILCARANHTAFCGSRGCADGIRS